MFVIIIKRECILFLEWKLFACVGPTWRDALSEKVLKIRFQMIMLHPKFILLSLQSCELHSWWRLPVVKNQPQMAERTSRFECTVHPLQNSNAALKLITKYYARRLIVHVSMGSAPSFLIRVIRVWTYNCCSAPDWLGINLTALIYERSWKQSSRC